LHRNVRTIALVCAAALALAACKNATQIFEDNNEGGLFSKPLDTFSRPSWAKATVQDKSPLNPTGPVAPEELVAADGQCSVVVPPLAQAPAQSAAQPAEDDKVGTVAGDLGNQPAPTRAAVIPNDALPSGAPSVMGGVALGMTECDVVRRAGIPANVNLTAGEKGERRVVLTYLTGPWPGIYTFDSGRLRIVDRAPAPPAPEKPVKTKKATKPAKPKTATAPVARGSVQ
jgi:hypothetical protein